MKVATRQIKAFIESVPPNIHAILLHGIDVGLISQRAKTVAAQLAPDLDDVFAVTKLDGDQIAGDPALLGDSAESIAMTADRRLVWVKGRGTEMLEGCKTALQRNLQAAFIIVEATETTTRHALVKLFDNAENAASIGCYPDTARDIGSLMDDILGRDNVGIDSDARALVIERLGIDHATSRSEVEKLSLLAGPGGRLDYETVNSALGDSASQAISDIGVAVADGNVAVLEKSLIKAWADNQNAVMVLRGSQGYFKQLLSLKQLVIKGTPAPQAVRNLRPPVHFKLQDRMVSQSGKWSPTALMDAVSRLQDAELAVKTGAPDDQIQCGQALLGICLRAAAARR